jgi:prevent-host-death family protein
LRVKRALSGRPANELPVVSTSDLSRSPRSVLDRVARGERLLVNCHGRPIATLQPLDGVVMQPFTGGAHDIFGWPVGGALEEAGKLSDIHRAMLTYGVIRRLRLTTARPWDRFEGRNFSAALEELGVLGLAKKTERGWELTARGMALREALVQEGGDLSEL